ncbi:MAG: hypothetical protein ACRD2N_25895, partial [Vicinamibacterales bacterium]
MLWIAGRGIGREAAGWTALALVGQACALQLVLAGPTVRPQIFRGWNDLLNGPRVVFVAAVVAQAVIVIAGLRSHWPAILPGASRILSWPMALALSAVLIFSATTMPMEVALALASGSVADLVVQAGGHASKFALSLFLLITGFLSLLLAAATVPTATWERLERWWRT